MLTLFRTVFFCAITLSFSAGALIAASFFIADRAPQSDWYIGVHLVVTGVFLSLGVLLFGIQRHVSEIARNALYTEDTAAGKLRHHVKRLLVYLLVGGTVLGAILGLLTYAILARIDQGFAVFG